MRSFRPIGIVVVLATIVAAACAEPAAPERRGPSLSTTGGQSLVACESGVARSTKALLGPLGGTVAVEGVSVQVPAGALLAPVELTVTVPASRYLIVDIDATGFEHFVFEAPITVAMDYSRCPPGQIERGPISVWYVGDDAAMLEQMPTLDDRGKKRVTFLTGHLSGYAIAN